MNILMHDDKTGLFYPISVLFVTRVCSSHTWHYKLQCYSHSSRLTRLIIVHQAIRSFSSDAVNCLRIRCRYNHRLGRRCTGTSDVTVGVSWRQRSHILPRDRVVQWLAGWHEQVDRTVCGRRGSESICRKTAWLQRLTRTYRGPRLGQPFDTCWRHGRKRAPTNWTSRRTTAASGAHLFSGTSSSMSSSPWRHRFVGQLSPAVDYSPMWWVINRKYDEVTCGRVSGKTMVDRGY